MKKNEKNAMPTIIISPESLRHDDEGLGKIYK